MKPLALTIAFLLELVAFAAFAGISFLLPGGKVLHIAGFVVLLAGLIAFWSVCMAPKAPKKFKPMAYYAAKACVYAVAAFTLLYAYPPLYGILFVAAVLVDEALLFRHNLS